MTPRTIRLRIRKAMAVELRDGRTRPRLLMLQKGTGLIRPPLLPICTWVEERRVSASLPRGTRDA